MKHVWYAAYGSNLWLDRFLVYLGGGTPPGGSRQHPGARNASPPTASQTRFTNRALRFGGESTNWAGGGVAFLDSESSNAHTALRLYLITPEQFEDVFFQENGLAEPVALDLATARNHGHLDAHERRYGRVLHLGTNDDGRPIFTITAHSPPASNAPDPRYVHTIVSGLTTTVDGRSFGLESPLDALEHLAPALDLAGFTRDRWQAVISLRN